MSPLKVLGRGYAMVQREDGAIVRSWRDAPAETDVRVTLGEGGLACTVKQALKGEREQ
jgi:exodeoxyribonuclease VII large subunit